MLVQTLLGFNRTFMELKSYDKYALLSPLACFNRTFMELKLSRKEARVPFREVLIVPLWN